MDERLLITTVTTIPTTPPNKTMSNNPAIQSTIIHHSPQI